MTCVGVTVESEPDTCWIKRILRASVGRVLHPLHEYGASKRLEKELCASHLYDGAKYFDSLGLFYMLRFARSRAEWLKRAAYC